MNVVILIVDAISYKYSWLKSPEHFPSLYKASKNFLNFHNHYGVSNGTRNNLATILSGLPPSLHKTMNRKNSFRKNKYFNIQKILSSKDYYTLYFGTQPLFHSEKDGDNLDFSETVYLSPSMADYYIPGLNFNKFIINKHEQIKKRKHFCIYHYTDVHAPFEPPKIKFKDTKKIRNFLFKNFYHIFKRYIWLKVQRIFSSKVKTILNKYPHLSKNSFPLGQIISLERYPLNTKFYNEVWKTKNLLNDYFQMHKNASNYQDKSLQEILYYFKNNSKNTIFLMLADHGNSDLIDPEKRKKDGILLKDLTHVPFSIFSFDDHINKKFNLYGNVSELSSHSDIFNTILKLLTELDLKKEIPNSYFQDLLNIKSSNRYIFSEFNDLRSGKGRSNSGEVKMFNLNEEYLFNILSSDEISDILEKENILNKIKDNDYKKYFEYKSELNKNAVEIKEYLKNYNYI